MDQAEEVAAGVEASAGAARAVSTTKAARIAAANRANEASERARRQRVYKGTSFAARVPGAPYGRTAVPPRLTIAAEGSCSERGAPRAARGVADATAKIYDGRASSAASPPPQRDPVAPPARVARPSAGRPGRSARVAPAPPSERSMVRSAPPAVPPAPQSQLSGRGLGAFLTAAKMQHRPAPVLPRQPPPPPRQQSSAPMPLPERGSSTASLLGTTVRRPPSLERAIERSKSRQSMPASSTGWSLELGQ